MNEFKNSMTLPGYELESESCIIFDLLQRVKTMVFDENFKFTNQNEEYNVGHDSKILSKIYEIIIVHNLKRIFTCSEFSCIENTCQNKYPDFIVVSKVNPSQFYAIDIKTTYLKNISENLLNGFTLGTYKGYFLHRESARHSLKPYKFFYKHFCIGIVYDRNAVKNSVKHIIIKEKWQLASKRTGSGNTNNIGGIRNLKEILDGKTCFISEQHFDQFWKEYSSKNKNIVS